ncbi:MAG: hypothetical protein WC444_05980 [Candidatus Paceibacterota bacterium]
MVEPTVSESLPLNMTLKDFYPKCDKLEKMGYVTRLISIVRMRDDGVEEIIGFLLEAKFPEVNINRVNKLR